jgi:hypothetical protein
MTEVSNNAIIVLRRMNAGDFLKVKYAPGAYDFETLRHESGRAVALTVQEGERLFWALSDARYITHTGQSIDGVYSFFRINEAGRNFLSRKDIER